MGMPSTVARISWSPRAGGARGEAAGGGVARGGAARDGFPGENAARTSSAAIGKRDVGVWFTGVARVYAGARDVSMAKADVAAGQTDPLRCRPMLPDPESNVAERLSPEDLLEAWQLLVPEDRLESFKALSRPEAEDLFLSLSARDQAEIVRSLPPPERRSWMRLLPPDDCADLVQEIPHDDREDLLSLLDDNTRKDVNGLLAYAEDDAGGLMNPRYVRVRPDMSVDEAITYLRRQAAGVGALNYAYAIDQDQKLRGVISFRKLLAARPEQHVQEVMQTDLVTVPEKMDQEEVSRLF